MPGAVPGRGLCLRVRLSLTFALDPAQSPRGALCSSVGRSSSSVSLVQRYMLSPRVAVASQGHAGCPGAGCAAGHGSCGAAGWTSAGLQGWMRRSEAGRSSIVRVSALPLACCSLPYEWRPLRPSGKEFTPESGLCLRVRASTAQH